MIWLVRTLICSVVIVPLLACQPNYHDTVEDYEPERATGWSDREAVVSSSYMVAAANEKASQAGIRVLEAGGNAIDAAVAVQAMLTLVEPQSSGIGGGAFLLYWDAEAQQLFSLDARETAPSAATPELFLDEQGNAPRWIEAIGGGRSVGAPGVVAGLELAHQRWGQLPWAALFNDTIELAEQGFVVSERLAMLVKSEMNPWLPQLSAARDYFYPNGEPIAAGTVKQNPQLADTLRLIAEGGANAFYQGPVAEAIVYAVQNSEVAPGLLSIEDLENYRPVWREPVCSLYRTLELCSMGPPSSGGLTVLQILGLLEHFELANKSVNSTQAIHWFTQASRLAFADRNRYIADTDFVDIPLMRLLAPDYLARRADLIVEEDMGRAEAGDIEAGYALAYDQSLDLPSTSHFSIVDAQGNAVSMTTTIEMGFGSAVMVKGFLLNNQLTDFSLVPEVDGRLVANRVEPNKRPRSSMAPVIAFDPVAGEVRHVLGSPGGPRIINYVAQTLIGLIDWQLDMQSAIDMPRVTNMNGVTSIENSADLTELAEALRARGHEVEIRSLNSGIHGITRMPDGRLLGGADPRREGKVIGQ
ncbi:MAG: gamma-glutamyltransferase [Idiomarina sp.]|nr:gamma-glutamyltransferase [Idiomarina sp.]